MIHPNQQAPQTRSSNHHHQQQQHQMHHHQSQFRPSIDQSDAGRPHRLDLYSIPVFILEILVLALLALFAYYIHFIYFLEPLVTGFYCDDKDYRKSFEESDLTKHLINEKDELTVLALLIAIPITIIIFCELVNSMFGSIRFRRVRALCKCCKLHSITRRAIRFSGAYLLGFLLVSISCDILSSSAGRLRPYFEQDCPVAYRQCQQSQQQQQLTPSPVPQLLSSSSSSTPSPPIINNLTAALVVPTGELVPVLPTTAAAAPAPVAAALQSSSASISSANPSDSSRIRDGNLITTKESTPSTTFMNIAARNWVDLNDLGPNMSVICAFNEDNATSADLYRFHQLAKSWPSHPGSIFAFACLFLAAYLSFAGTARPVRILTCVIVLALLMIAIIFNVQLVKDHYQHSDDVLAAGALALIVTLFIVIVYLNFFRDTHYYERQKMISSPRNFVKVHENFHPYNPTASEFGTYNLDDGNHSDNSNDDQLASTPANGGPIDSHLECSGAHGGAGSNDLAMRYFQIPRANYRN